MAVIAQEKIEQGTKDEFYFTKVSTAQFYFDRILPRTLMHVALIKTNSESLYSLSPELL
ncbi:hypothetical protein P23_1128 [Acinetobacter calcoaceticus]|nr:acyl-CoA dehydrogenase C-terminal domain-containing protein [Acinetobacter calcoaceticus]GAM30625.1 hypothetical protein P23_1128 [Acinetobacter calcoaceticus]